MLATHDQNLILHHFWFMFIGNGDNKNPDSGGQKEKKKKTLLTGNIVI